MKTGKVLFVVFTALAAVIMLALLELNRNTLWGFALTAALTAAFCALHRLAVNSGRGLLARAGLWAGWTALFVGVLLLTWPPVRAVPAVAAKHPERTGTVRLAQGELRGVYNADGDVEVFAGIPYAKPPVGELRWRPPQDAEDWDGILEADRFAPMSMQPVNLPIVDSLTRIIGFHDYRISLDDNYTGPVSEDSLYLNIWKPAGDAGDLPVLVYIHGGSLQTGQPWYADYSGEGLAREGVIVVNMGYRLGVFGYYAEQSLLEESGTTGNYGLLDQIKALEWVRDNIAAFGGDPGNVTLAGESAGAASVSALCTSPLAKGLFERVILESSTVASKEPPHSFRPLGEALESGRGSMRELGCSSIDEMRALPAEKLVGLAYTHHHMTVDGRALAETPFESYRKGIHNEKAVLHGYNSEESAAFIIFDHADMGSYESRLRTYFGDLTDDALALYPASTDDEADRCWAEIYGAIFFDYPHYCLARLAAENGIPAYQYYFSRHNGSLGPWHSGEEIYCYGNIPPDSRLYDARDRELSREMTAYWKNFAVSGDPNGSGLPVWERNDSASRVMSFSDTTEMADEPEHELFALLDRLYGWEE